MPSSENPLPDIAIGRHPDFGIIATSPKDLAASAWMLRGFDFHPVPDHPDLYALADQQRDGHGRTARVVAILRRAHYRVQADAEFDTFPKAPEPDPIAALPQHTEPEVAFAEHPLLGIVAATTDSSVLGRKLLDEHGWLPHPRLDIHALPPATSHDQALATVAQATAAMNRAGLPVAVQPALARDIIARYPPAPATSVPGQPNPEAAARRFPALNAAALAASPARARRPATPPVPAPASAPATPVDLRVAFPRPQRA